MSVGKRFEYELLKAFKTKHPDGYCKRFTDSMFGKGMSQASPPDFIINVKEYDALVECKAVKGISLPFSRLSLHQLQELEHYDSISDRHSGYVAVLYYNGQRGRGRSHRAWLIPITYWSTYQDKYPRKSMSVKHVERDLKENECIWVPGKGWKLPSWL
jgi:hypothetical protein